MISKIPIERGKDSWRYQGIGLSRAEEAIIMKINEMLDASNDRDLLDMNECR